MRAGDARVGRRRRGAELAVHTGARRAAGTLAPAALLLGLAAGPAGAQEAEPLVTDRPDFTESTAVVSRPQLEAGYTLSSIEGHDEHALGEVLLRWPVVPALELRLALNSFVAAGGTRRPDSGFEDAAAGLKLALTDGADRFDLFRPAAALLLATTIPTGTAGFGTEQPQPEAKLALGWPISRRTRWSVCGPVLVSADGRTSWWVPRHRRTAQSSLGMDFSELGTPGVVTTRVPRLREQRN